MSIQVLTLHSLPEHLYLFYLSTLGDFFCVCVCVVFPTWYVIFCTCAILSRNIPLELLSKADQLSHFLTSSRPMYVVSHACT